jgi:hypothetical protein
MGALAAAALFQVFVVGVLAFSGWLPPAGVAWLGALALACYAARLPVQRFGQHTISVAEVRHRTGRPKGPGR